MIEKYLANLGSSQASFEHQIEHLVDSVQKNQTKFHKMYGKLPSTFIEILQLHSHTNINATT